MFENINYYYYYLNSNQLNDREMKKRNSHTNAAREIALELRILHDSF